MKPLRTQPGSLPFLLYEDTTKMDVGFKLMLVGILAMTLGVGIYLLFGEPDEIEGAFAMFGVTAFDALLFKYIMSPRFQIYSDRVRIVFGGPFAWNIPLSTIKEVRSASGAKAFAYNGVRFATSSRNVVEITRIRGCNVVISPSNKEIFLEQANRALGSQRSLSGNN